MQSVTDECTCEYEAAHNPLIAPYYKVANDPELSRVVKKWGSLPQNLKDAVMAIVGTIEG